MIKLDFASLPPANVSTARLRQAVVATEHQAKLRFTGSVAVKFVDRATSRQYNQRYAKQDYPTDVLSFAYHEDENETEPIEAPSEAKNAAENPLGDIIICSPIATDQARDHNISLEAEITLLLIHGILHIAGRDHQKPADKASFAQIQNAIMEELALPAREYFHDHTN